MLLDVTAQRSNNHFILSGQCVTIKLMFLRRLLCHSLYVLSTQFAFDLCRQLEYEIQTLRSVLAVKIREANELKRKLGITTMTELKDDLRHGVQTVRDSDV